MTTKTRGDFIHEWLVEWTSRHASTNATTSGMDEFVARAIRMVEDIATRIEASGKTPWTSATAKPAGPDGNVRFLPLSTLLKLVEECIHENRFDSTTLETLRDTLRCCADAAQTACEESRR
jgi:hypothetical protein